MYVRMFVYDIIYKCRSSVTVILIAFGIDQCYILNLCRKNILFCLLDALF